jgi:hypothetical protein
MALQLHKDFLHLHGPVACPAVEGKGVDAAKAEAQAYYAQQQQQQQVRGWIRRRGEGGVGREGKI